MPRWSSPSSSACSKHCTTAGSISASAGRRAPTGSPPTRCAARPTRSPRAVSPTSGGAAGLLRRQLPRPASLPGHHRGARSGLPAGGVALGLQRLQRPAGRPARHAVLVRAPFRGREHRPRGPRLPVSLPTLAESRRAPSHARRRRHLRRDDRRGPLAGGTGGLGDSPAPLRTSGPLPDPEEAAEYHFTPSEREIVKAWTASQIVGAPEDVRARIEELVDRTGADELIVTTMMHGAQDRVRSYELPREPSASPPPTRSQSAPRSSSRVDGVARVRPEIAGGPWSTTTRPLGQAAEGSGGTDPDPTAGRARRAPARAATPKVTSAAR